MTTPTTVQVRLKLRRDTAANWTTANPTLLAGEVGLESDTNKIKIGDGTTAWTSLGYFPFVVSGGVVTGNLEIGTTGTLTFEGSSTDNFETTLGVVNPTADRTINLPNQSGTVIVSGNTSIVNADISASAAIAHSKLANITAGYVLIGNASNVPTATQVTGDVTISSGGVTAISSGVIVDGDISASAEIAVSKLADGAARQLLQTDAAGTGVEWTDNVDVPGTLDVTGAATFDSSVTITGDLTVNGTTTNINTQNLVVEDKNVILGDVATPTDVTADGGGITLKGATDKTITWSDTSDSWEFNQPTITTGTSTAASFIPTSSTVPTNGVYLPAANSVALATNGTGRLFINSTGLVAIGNASFDQDLTIEDSQNTGTAADNVGLTLRSINRSSLLRVTSNPGFSSTIELGDTDATNAGAIAYNNSNNNLFFTVNSSERLRITSGGNVGIGTSSPSGLLHLQGASIAESWYTATNAGGATWRVGTADTSSGLSGAYRIYDSTNSAARLLIDNTGNVGIGTTVPVTKLHVSGGAMRIDGAQQMRFYNTTSTELAYIQSEAVSSTNPALVFGTGNTERARIDSSGRLLVGTSSAQAISSLSGFEGLQVIGTGSAAGQIIGRFTNDASSSSLTFSKSRGATVGTNTVVASGDDIGVVRFSAADGTSYLEAARILAEVDGTPGANDMPGRLVFSTTADGASSPTERMRIVSSGAIYTLSDGFNALVVSSTKASGSTDNLIVGNYGATTYNNGTASFVVKTDGDVTNTNNSYGAISDIKLKENIVDANSQWDDLKALQVRNYNFKEGQTHTQIGLIAQEVELVSPGLVSESPDRDEEGNDLGTVTKSVNYSVLYMKAVKALQEAMERIETIEAKVAALEA